MKYLGLLQLTIGLDASDANQTARRDAIALINNECKQLIAARSATAADRDRIVSMLTRAGLNPIDVASNWKQLERLVDLNNLREGNLSPVRVGIAYRAGEVFYFYSVGSFASRTKQGQWHTTSGELFLSNQRLLFATYGTNRSFEIRLSAVIDVDSKFKGLHLRTTSARGTGIYSTKDNERLEATLIGVLRTERMQNIENFVSERSRIIPTHVKQQVWARDQARCIICGLSDNIHYDHDIPFSKGGSNTVENIRLLCVSCNLKKSDRIE